MISDEDRKALIKYRLTQARDTIDISRFLFDSGKLNVAVNRIYYGMYYTLTALALKYKFETSKHSQLIGWFNREFVSSNKLDVKYGQILRNAFQNRTKSDYDAYIEFTPHEVEVMLKEMKDFISAVESLIC